MAEKVQYWKYFILICIFAIFFILIKKIYKMDLLSLSYSFPAQLGNFCIIVFGAASFETTETSLYWYLPEKVLLMILSIKPMISGNSEYNVHLLSKYFE